MKNIAKNAKKGSKKLLNLSNNDRNQILLELADRIERSVEKIIEANRIDIINAEIAELPSSIIDRLLLDEMRIKNMADGVRKVADQEDVVGEVFDKQTNEDGMQIMKKRIPIGVILMIFESRPNVVIDCAALAIKSGNAIILKGGKEAIKSNEVLSEIIESVLTKKDLSSSVQVLSSDDRNAVKSLLKMNEEIDLVIPRGGENLINFVHKTATMPVIAHFNGICHMYVDQDASLDQAKELIINGKTQRPGVCNSIETVLVHKNVVEKFAPLITEALNQKSTEIRADKSFQSAVKAKIKLATNNDWNTEYLDNIISIKTVESLDEAINHIDKYGSNHSECIISDNKESCDKFISRVDASCVMVNASTRFNDGSQLGLGAELGISTTKLHAYGPMGIKQMTTSKFVVVGNGHTRS